MGKATGKGRKVAPGREPDVNVKLAKAGALLLSGEVTAVGEALVRSGYKRSTARNPTANGINAARCIAEAKRLNPGLSGANLLRDARRVYRRSLRLALAADKVPLAHAARALEVAEKAYGDRFEEGGAERDARTFFDRVQSVQALLAEAARRGLIAPGPAVVHGNDGSRELDGGAGEVDAGQSEEDAGARGLP